MVRPRGTRVRSGPEEVSMKMSGWIALSLALCAWRSATAAETAPPNARPCARAPEYRQLDFWVGEWDVTAQGKPAGTSSVQLILDDCVVFENWTGVKGMTGKSFNLYDATRKRWQQTWVDSSGSLLEFHGSFKDGALRYTGESPVALAAGQVAPTAAMHKLTFFDQGPEQVRQLWEQSTDGGKTWTVLFDGTYRRRKR
jgi:hypothetical protein